MPSRSSGREWWGQAQSCCHRCSPPAAAAASAVESAGGGGETDGDGRARGSGTADAVCGEVRNGRKQVEGTRQEKSRGKPDILFVNKKDLLPAAASNVTH